MSAALAPRPTSAPAPMGLDFRTIFEMEFDYVWRSLRRLGVRERDVDDLAHDTFLVVYRTLDQYDPSRPLRPWLFGIASRHAANYRRRAQHRGDVMEHASEVVDPARGADEALASRQTLDLVQEALDALDDDRRSVFVLHELDGASMPDIAAALSIPLNTAYSRLRLAREHFSAAVRRLRAARGER
ncbi:MAG: sigma-70 family RNA polymerase sigma factor [Polyangiales bacterium]